MSVSGSIDFNMVANQIIRKAFQILGVAAEGESVSADMYARGLESLNLLIKTWSAQEHLWTRESQSLTLVAGQAPYVITPKPMRILSARRKNTASGYETPMTMWARQQYLDQPNKTTSLSTPVNFYYDPQRAIGTLYVWPAPSAQVAAAFTIEMEVLRRMDDMDASNNDADLPQEWLQALIWNLADDLITEYPVNDGNIASKIERKAAMLYADLKGWDNEPASIFLSPDVMPWR